MPSTGEPSGSVPTSPCAAEHPILLALLEGVLEEGSTFVDVGANEGYFAIPAAGLVGAAGRVLAFEPAADAAHRLRSAGRERGLNSRITLFRFALGSGDGSAALRADPEQPDDSTKRSLFLSDGTAVAEVAVRSFDGLVACGAVELPHGIDAVKIDVEGGEVHVLKGMQASLTRHRPSLVMIETIESHLRRAGATVGDVHAFMTEIGYVAFAEPRLELNAVFVPS
jgi:FkbM family methyltransferase